MTEREKFEAWLRPQFINENDFKASIRKCGTWYANNITEFQWDAWQARAAQDEWISVDDAPKDTNDYLLWFGSDQFAVGWFDGREWLPSNVETTYDMSSIMFECDSRPIKYKPLPGGPKS